MHSGLCTSNLGQAMPSSAGALVQKAHGLSTTTECIAKEATSSKEIQKPPTQVGTPLSARFPGLPSLPVVENSAHRHGANYAYLHRQPATLLDTSADITLAQLRQQQISVQPEQVKGTQQRSSAVWGDRPQEVKDTQQPLSAIQGKWPQTSGRSQEVKDTQQPSSAVQGEAHDDVPKKSPHPDWLLTDLIEMAETSCAAKLSRTLTPKQKVAIFFVASAKVKVLGKDKMHVLKPGAYEARVIEARNQTSWDRYRTF